MNKVNKIFGFIAALLVTAFVAWLMWVFITNINAADASIKAGLIGIFGALTVGGAGSLSN